MIENEAEIIRKAKEGDVESFEFLINGCKEKAYATAYSSLLNEQDAQDVLQECFIKVFINLANYEEEKSSFETWLHHIVVNACKNFLRDNQKRKQAECSCAHLEGDGSVFDVADPSPTPEEALCAKEELKTMMKHIDSLGKEQREVMRLFAVDGYSYEEISEIMECSIETVNNRISRARINLRKFPKE